MKETLIEQIQKLKDIPLEDLRSKYKEVFKVETPPSNNRTLLWRKIAYKLQEIEYGGLNEQTQGRIKELIERYDPVNNKSLRPTFSKDKKDKPARDRRLPIPGTVIKKEYKGRTLEVKILEEGFEFNNSTYRTLTAIAKEATGAHWNGYLFFNL